jgi:16S rRNA (adenine1518-N6/adenine1519-N6)-dimethyltransferase
LAAAHRRPPLGQNFLFSPSFLARIGGEVVSAARRAGLIIEIGAGPGSLTKHLLEAGKPVTAIELDPRLVARLRSSFGSHPDLEVIEGDVLKLDLRGLIAARAASGNAVVAGNLPYYITSPILRRVFDAAAGISTALFLVQKEVAERITARPGIRDFGYLSVLCQAYAKPEIRFLIPPGAFRPPPKVTSALVRLDLEPRLEEWGITNPEAFLDFVKLCFCQKRKTLFNNLLRQFPRGLLEARLAEIPELRLRAEQIEPERLAGIWLLLSGHGEALMPSTGSGD